jgi:hypothetical protein
MHTQRADGSTILGHSKLELVEQQEGEDRMWRIRLQFLAAAILAASCSGGDTPAASPTAGSPAPAPAPAPPPASAHSYSTTFPATENPLSENGRWVDGKTTGLAWSDFRSSSGFVYGTQSGTNAGKYDDSIALLTGTWGPNQTVQATVRTINQNDSIFEELEIRLRSTVTPNGSTGYECNFSARSSANAYVQIVRWNGAFGDWTLLNGKDGSSMALHDGDTIKCTISGSTITAYINGVQMLQVTDGTYSGGNPGIGAFLQNATGVNNDYGFTSFSASD